MNPARDAPVRAERVEVVPHGEDELSVLVEGRLEDARRLPSRAILVVEAAGGGKHRFTQIAEPGNRAGMRDRRWSARFLVPSALTSSLAGRSTLFIGDEEIPLPGADRAPAARRQTAAPAMEAASTAV